jgi:hypothetical protein
MRKSRLSEEQIARVLKEAELGVPVAELTRREGVSDVNFYRWKAKFGGMEVNDARRMIEAWRLDYNAVRPHSSLGYLTPEEFAASVAAQPASPPTPVAPTVPAGALTVLQETPSATLSLDQ